MARFNPPLYRAPFRLQLSKGLRGAGSLRGRGLVQDMRRDVRPAQGLQREAGRFAPGGLRQDGGGVPCIPRRHHRVDVADRRRGGSFPEENFQAKVIN